MTFPNFTTAVFYHTWAVRCWPQRVLGERTGTHFRNDGGTAWVLGYKTERGGTLVHTLGGGRSEIIGGFSYTTTAGKLAPMFVSENASLFAFFAEVCYSGDPFQTLVQETRGGEKKVIRKGEGHTLPYVGFPVRQGR